MSDSQTKQDWITDEEVTPPYPLLRCPECRRIFSDHEIHICEERNVG